MAEVAPRTNQAPAPDVLREVGQGSRGAVCLSRRSELLMCSPGQAISRRPGRLSTFTKGGLRDCDEAVMTITPCHE
jgi:hypothetical protein